MTFFLAHAQLESKLAEIGEVTLQDVEKIQETLPYLRKEQLSFLLALILYSAAKEQKYSIGSNNLPYSCATIGGKFSPSFEINSISIYTYKIILLFLREIEK